GYAGGYAYGINNENQIAGFVFTSPGSVSVPFYTDSMGNIQIVPGLSSAKAYAINNSGLVVGSVGSGTSNAWVYDGSTLTTIDTGSTVNFVSYGAVNDSGQVVGSGGGGWIWTATGGAVGLNTLVSPDWNITAAYSISNTGLILAAGSQNGGANEWVELSPAGTPEPGTIGLAIGGFLLCALFARRKVRQTSASGC
ncbi:MAG: hypothetical protein KGN84_05115, partial [Acidobacteriota bacterium]|nr:hypothetical protein [Acidobacteriota bacterium]